MGTNPNESYGVLMARSSKRATDLVVEEVQTLGWAIVEEFVSLDQVDELRAKAVFLLERNASDNPKDANIVRAPWSHDVDFLQLACLPLVLDVLRELIPGKVVLNQQNLVRSPGRKGEYSQARYHRDLPYQHFVASRPLAINVLVCLDDFLIENGATSILPASHKEELFPSLEFIERHSVVATAPRGSLIILDGMTFHSGRRNMTERDRIAVNHVYSSPLLKPQLEHKQLATPEIQASFSKVERDLLNIDPQP